MIRRVLVIVALLVLPSYQVPTHSPDTSTTGAVETGATDKTTGAHETSAVPVTTASPCVDVDLNCDKMKIYCEKPGYKPLLEEKCAKTCGFCGLTPPPTSATCHDDPSVDCHQYLKQCDDPAYKDIMERFCKATCHLCDPNCKDSSKECGAWNKNANFCKNPAYTDADKKKYCAKTCNLCNK